MKIANDQTEEAKLVRLKEEIDKGWEQADRGEFADYSIGKIKAELGWTK